jgi:endonuclease/exonuclease/phosphatase family metal-dependent hydrolase
MTANARVLRTLLPLFAASIVAGVGCSALPGVGGSGPSNEADTVRIMAYNIRHGEGTDGKLDLNRIADVIEEQSPDIVTLQEVDRRVDRTDGEDQARRLAARTGMDHAFGAFMDYDGGEYGMAILSRWPIVSVTNERLPDGDEPRTALKVRVRSPETGRELVVVGIHFYRTDDERLAQADRLLATLASEQAPIVLAGDFNSTPDSRVIGRFEDGWNILSKGRDRLTFPSTGPEREIDYIMVRPARNFYVLSHDVLDEPLASDHRPLIADLVVRPR